MKKEMLDKRLDEYLETANAEEYKAEGEYRCVYSYDLDKDIAFTPQEMMDEAWFLDKTHTPKSSQCLGYSLNYEKLCKFAFAHLDKELLTTLSAVFFLEDETDLQDLYEFSGDEYALECIDMDECIGLMWFYRNIVLVNVRTIIQVSQDVCLPGEDPAREIEIGVLSTLAHELRHLMLDTNVLLDAEMQQYADERSVEEYGNKFAELHQCRFVEEIAC